MRTLRASPAALLLALTSCQSTWYDYRFAPGPQEVRVVDERVEGSQARALVSIIGIRRPKDEAPARIEVRLRLENLGSAAFTLGLHGMELVTAELNTFDLSRLVPPDERSLAPGESRVFTANFDLPPEAKPKNYDFGGVVLKWELDFGQGPIATSMNFQRVVVYDDGVQTHIGVGVGYWGGH